MRRAFVMMIAVFGLGCMAMAAEDANGTWKASFDAPNGPVAMTIVLKVEGGAVTGTVSSDQMGEQKLTPGKVDGDKVTFSITADFGVISYEGTVKGDDMKLKVTVGDGQFTLEGSAKRQK